jgi:hypothetical protein
MKPANWLASSTHGKEHRKQNMAVGTTKLTDYTEKKGDSIRQIVKWMRIPAHLIILDTPYI